MKNKKNEEFLNFLESLASEQAAPLLESIKKGFQACFEAQEDLHKVLTTYEIVDEESARQGDSKEHGWHDEEGEVMDPDSYDLNELIEENAQKLNSLQEPEKSNFLNSLKTKLVITNTVKFLTNHGASEYSASTFYPNGWWMHNGEMDPKTGEYTNYGYHLKGYTDEEMKAVYDMMKAAR